MIAAAPRWRRWFATCIDVGWIAPLLWTASRSLPRGGPPAGSMSFYSPQDFKNYMTVVLWAVFATIAAVFVARSIGTPGDRFAGIRLTSLDGAPPGVGVTLGRAFFAMAKVMFVMLPGPVIALVVTYLAASGLRIPMSTADAALQLLGVSAGTRNAIHGLSFLALGVGLWFVALRPLAQRKALSTEPTPVDRRTALRPTYCGSQKRRTGAL